MTGPPLAICEIDLGAAEIDVDGALVELVTLMTIGDR